MAPELALGVLDGSQRADALAHVTGCAACRAYLGDLSRTADSLLLAGPEAEPPAGFEAAVLHRLLPAPTGWAARLRPLAAAAVVIGIALGLGVYAGRESAPTAPVTAGALRSAPLISRSGREVGAVYLHQDDRESWCFVSITAPRHEGVYDVAATLRDGRVIAIERFAVKDGKGSYGRTLDVPATDIVAMTMVSTDGKWTYKADLST